MSGLKERLGFKPKQKTVEQSIEEQIIEPATGTEKERLERDCIEYLQNPDQTTASDFSEFARNMIQLIGGERRKSENGEFTHTSSNPLIDQETQTSITLTVKNFTLTKGYPITQTEIEAESTDTREELLFRFSPRFKHPPPNPSFSISPKIPPKFDSYITGKKESVLSNAGMELKPTEVKGFARRVFAVYQRQLPAARVQTPQA